MNRIQGLSFFVIYFFSSPSVLVNGAKIQSEEAINFRLPSDVVPIKYSIKIVPYIIEGNFTFDGESNILVNVTTPTKTLTLHAHGLEFREDKTRLVKFGFRNARIPISQRLETLPQFLILTFKDKLKPGKYNLHLEYKGLIKHSQNGFYRSFYEENGTNVWMAATHFEPNYARTAFPCWDEPALKAAFDISIKHFPNYTAVSNMPVASREFEKSEGKVWTHFRTTPVMSTYMIGYVLCDYVSLSAKVSNTTIGFWARARSLPEMEYAFNVGRQILPILEEFTNATFVLPKLDNLAIRNFNVGAIENWGVIMYTERRILVSNVSTMVAREEVARVVAHEMAHQWFGNLVTPSWWNYLWLNEGFATYLECIVVEKIEKYRRLSQKCLTNDFRNLAMIEDTSLAQNVALNVEIRNVFEISRPFEYEEITYSKGASVLQMMSHILTEELFKAGLSQYLRLNQYKSVTPDDLWEAMQEAVDRSSKHAIRFDVKAVMDTWVMQAGYPIITATRNYTSGSMILRQERYVSKHEHNLTEGRGNRWWVPINFATKSNLNFNSTVSSHWMKPIDEDLIIHGLKAEDWVIVNIQDTGFYRVNYDRDNWKKITSYLNSIEYANIHVLNRVQLLNNVRSMMNNEYIDMDIFLDVVAYLHRETDHVVWTSGLQCLHALRGKLQHMVDHILVKKYILHLMDRVINEAGFTVEKDEDHLKTIFRNSIIYWVCRLGHRGCRNYFAQLHINHRRDPIAYPISPDINYMAHCVGLSEANETIWNQEYEMYKRRIPINFEDIRILACTENSTLAMLFLREAFEKSVVQEDHLRFALSSVFSKDCHSTKFVFQFLEENKAIVIKRLGNNSTVLKDILYTVLREKVKTLDDLNEFSQSTNRLGNMVDRRISESIAEASRRIHFNAKKQDEVRVVFDHVKNQLMKLGFVNPLDI